MATKAELIEYGQAHGVAVDDSMLKTDIEQALRDAGHDPNTLTELTSEDPPTGDPQMSDEPQQSPPPEEPTDPGALERSMAATDPQPYIDLQENFGALAYYAWQQRQPPEPEFPDSPVVKNHNVW
jgi:hypothetical protein